MIGVDGCYAGFATLLIMLNPRFATGRSEFDDRRRWYNRLREAALFVLAFRNGRHLYQFSSPNSLANATF
jgi:hypothetical protein